MFKSSCCCVFTRLLTGQPWNCPYSASGGQLPLLVLVTSSCCHLPLLAFFYQRLRPHGFLLSTSSVRLVVNFLYSFSVVNFFFSPSVVYFLNSSSVVNFTFSSSVVNFLLSSPVIYYRNGYLLLSTTFF